MRLLIRALIFFFITSLISSCSPCIYPSCSSSCTKINPKDIPFYPNAQLIKQEEKNNGVIDIFTWSYTTTDDPEKVWQFYKDKMMTKWDGEDTSNPRSTEKDIMIKGCFFYYFKMNSTAIDSTTYKITIEFSIQPYM